MPKARLAPRGRTVHRACNAQEEVVQVWVESGGGHVVIRARLPVSRARPFSLAARQSLRGSDARRVGGKGRGLSIPVLLGLEADRVGDGKPCRGIARSLQLEPLGEAPPFGVAPTDDGGVDGVLVLGSHVEEPSALRGAAAKSASTNCSGRGAGRAGSAPGRSVRPCGRRSSPMRDRRRRTRGRLRDLDDTEKLRAQFYLPCMQMSDAFIAMQPSGSALVVRSDNAGAGLLDSIRNVSQQISSAQVIFGAQSMEAVIADSLAGRRFSMILFGAFAILALLLASVGIYGVISYVVGQRTHEIGIRMALGACRSDILRLILRGAGKLTLIGIAVGLISALILTRLMARLLYGIGPSDPLTFIAVPVILISVALLACYLPARRATRVDPMVALRYE